jgi:hypothetical protein
MGDVGRLGSVFHLTREGVVKRRCAFLIAGLAVVGTVVAGTPASARPIDKGHFHDVFTSDVYDCDGIPAQDSGDVSGNFVFNQRGSSPFPYYRESVHGTVVTTNLETSTTTARPVTPATTSKSLTPSGSSAPPPVTATSRGATSARTWRSSLAKRNQSTPGRACCEVRAAGPTRTAPRRRRERRGRQDGGSAVPAGLHVMRRRRFRP